MLSVLQFLYDKITQGSHAPTVAPVPADAGGGVVVVRADHKIERVAGKAPVPGRMHTFADPPSFAAFVVKHWPNAAEVEILADETRIVATNKAAWFRDTLVGDMRKHPDWKAWTALFNGTYTQRSLYMAMVPIARCLSPEDKAVPEQVRALNVVSGAESNSVLSDNGIWTLVQSKAGTEIKSKLPGSFRLVLPIYLDGPLFDLEVKIMLDETVDGIKFRLVAIDRELVEISAYKERVSTLSALLGDAYLVGMGKLSFEG